MTQSTQSGLGCAGRLQVAGGQDAGSGPRRLAPKIALFDDGDGHALPGQLDGDREPDDSPAHDDDVFHSINRIRSVSCFSGGLRGTGQKHFRRSSQIGAINVA